LTKKEISTLGSEAGLVIRIGTKRRIGGNKTKNNKGGDTCYIAAEEPMIITLKKNQLTEETGSNSGGRPKISDQTERKVK